MKTENNKSYPMITLKRIGHTGTILFYISEMHGSFFATSKEIEDWKEKVKFFTNLNNVIVADYLYDSEKRIIKKRIGELCENTSKD